MLQLHKRLISEFTLQLYVLLCKPVSSVNLSYVPGISVVIYHQHHFIKGQHGTLTGTEKLSFNLLKEARCLLKEIQLEAGSFRCEATS